MYFYFQMIQRYYSKSIFVNVFLFSFFVYFDIMRYYKHASKKKCNKVYKKHTKSTKKTTKKPRNNQGRKTKKQLPLLPTTQPINKINQRQTASPIYIFTHKKENKKNKILQRKVFFRICIDCSSFSNNLQILFFQIVKKYIKE